VARRPMTPTPRRPRLDPSIFHLPVERMREGYYSDKYFVRARELLRKDRHRPRVTMQVFGKSHASLGGIDEAIAILKLCSDGWDELVVHALYDGEEIDPWETVLLIEGPYDAFANLETVYLGVLARRTRVGTNTRRVVEAELADYPQCLHREGFIQFVEIYFVFLPSSFVLLYHQLTRNSGLAVVLQYE